MISTLALFQLGPMEIVVFVVILLLLFGRRLPEIGRSLGRGIVEFKKGVKGLSDEVKDASDPIKDIRKDIDDQVNKSDKKPE
ncbi:MAG: twin-arginine translocase TatA/TatE family subunit [Planctomycetes bacterium]|nr:twin-arginine translocase TatA/TatE family subunit [Planctomycetota bacterium]